MLITLISEGDKKIQPELAKQPLLLYLKCLPRAHTSAHKISKYSSAYAVYRALSFLLKRVAPQQKMHF